MEVWFTSDEHYGHNNALKGWGNEQKARPFSSLEDMTEGLIYRHNSVVRRGDLVYHLGDMFWRTFGTYSAIDVMQRLNGTHYYIWGNHEEVFDQPGISETLKQQFVWLKERVKIKPDKILAPYGIVLDHYAGRVWDGSHKGTYQLYGHSHGALDRLEPHLLSMDVGVDSNDYFPVSLETVHRVMENKKERYPNPYESLLIAD